MEEYKRDFYTSKQQSKIYAANTILSIVFDKMPPIGSAIDVGCGGGAWLAVLKEKGVREIQGVDGNWVDQSVLLIPNESFMVADLSKPLTLPKKFDLLISLEVAEHLPCSSAKDFIITLTKLSDFILFSAAIPFQGGINHVNEQWQNYWGNLFDAQGYIGLDYIKKKIWNDKNIPSWYRQNILFYVNNKRISDIRISSEDKDFWPLSVVHPEIYLDKVNQMRSVKGSFKLFRRALKNYIKQKLKKRMGCASSIIR